MRILVNGHITTHRILMSGNSHYMRYLGWLHTPRNRMSFQTLDKFAYKLPMSADNSAFINFDERLYLNFINRIPTPTTLDWITAPDVVANAQATLESFEQWLERLEHLSLAFVAQDGAECMDLPWQHFTCLFIGGSTDWKLSCAAADLVAEAKRRGKTTHMGRVNSNRRLSHAYQIGCDSIDGTGYSRYSKKYLKSALDFLHNLHNQLTFNLATSRNPPAVSVCTRAVDSIEKRKEREMALYAALTPNLEPPQKELIKHSSHQVYPKIISECLTFKLPNTALFNQAKQLALEARGFGLHKITLKDLHTGHQPNECKTLEDFDFSLDISTWCEKCQYFTYGVSYKDRCQQCKTTIPRKENPMSEITTEVYQERFNPIISGWEPYICPTGSTTHDKQVVLTDGSRRFVKAEGQMCVTVYGNDGQGGIDPDFRHEGYLMDKLTQVPRAVASAEWTPKHFDFNGTEMTVRIDEIHIDAAYQMRVQGTDPTVVEKYAGIMKENDPEGWLAFPLIKLLRLKGEDGSHRDLYLISGFHRLEAMKQNGYEEIQAVITAATHLDGLILSSSENADRSQPRTNDDIRQIMEMFLTHPELSQWSNRQIAKWTQVDHQTVNNHERRLMSMANFAIDRPDKLKFLDKHGNISYRERKPPQRAEEVSRAKPKQPSPPQMSEAEKSELAEKEEAINALDASWVNAQNVFSDHPLAKYMEWHNLHAEVDTHLDDETLPIGYAKTREVKVVRQQTHLCDKVAKALTTNVKWVKDLLDAHKAKREADAEPIPASEEGGDLVGLREDIDDLLATITHDIAIEVPGLAGIYSVTEDVVKEEIAKAKVSRGIEESEPALEKTDDKSPRSLVMEEVEDLYASIEENIGDLPEPEQVEFRQFLKVNYDAYVTYGWRDRLKKEALETLAETLDQIQRGIEEKGLEAFKRSDPAESEQSTPLQIEPLGPSDAEAKAQADASGATNMMLASYIDDCKTAIENLLATEQVPLVLKYPAEGFLTALKKYIAANADE